jgi:ribosome recycling factor
MIDTLLATTRDLMKKAVEVTRMDVSTIHSGRATPALVENIMIAAYGGTQRLRLMELATITIQDAKSLLIQPFDPSVITEIEKGLLEANSGLTPVQDGEVIRISIPPLSQERREEYIKLAHTKLEGGRIMVRQARHEGMRKLKLAEDNKEISEDQQEYGDKKVQELTDEMIAEIDGFGERKEAELMQV